MLPTSQLVTYIPRLRRYARALCADRMTGDELVFATLRDTDLARLAASSDPLVPLFRKLNVEWKALSSSSPSHVTTTPKNYVGSLDPLRRQAFLLVAVGDFSCQEAGRILSCDPDELAAFIAESEQDVLKQMATDVLIIEDDRFVSEDLAAIMRRIGHDVFAVARTRVEAIDYARRRQPGLILCDLRLADGSSGLSAVDEINAGGGAPVIFITGNRQDMHHAANSAGEFYIPKPYSPREVRKVASRALLCHAPPVAE